VTDTARQKLLRQLMDLQLTHAEAEAVIDNTWGEIQQLMAGTYAKIIQLVVVEVAKAIAKRNERRDAVTLQWSEKPEKPGWYWWRQLPSERYPRGFQKIVYLEWVGKRLWWNSVRSINEEPGQWAGPMEPPEEMK